MMVLLVDRNLNIIITYIFVLNLLDQNLFLSLVRSSSEE